MAFWKQFVLSLIVIAAGFAGWIFLVPGAADVLRNAGVPENIVAKVAPSRGVRRCVARQGEGAREGGAGDGNGSGRNSAVLVVTQAVVQGVVNDRLNAIGTGDAIRSVVVTPQAIGHDPRNPHQVRATRSSRGRCLPSSTARSR